MIKEYYIFRFPKYYPNGGWEDLRSIITISDNFDIALKGVIEREKDKLGKYLDKECDDGVIDRIQIVDKHQNKLIWDSDYDQ